MYAIRSYYAIRADVPGILLHAEDGLGDQALARAGFTHQAPDLSFVERQVDLVNRLDPPLWGVDLYGQIADIV